MKSDESFNYMKWNPSSGCLCLRGLKCYQSTRCQFWLTCCYRNTATPPLPLCCVPLCLHFMLSLLVLPPFAIIPPRTPLTPPPILSIWSTFSLKDDLHCQTQPWKRQFYSTRTQEQQLGPSLPHHCHPFIPNINLVSNVNSSLAQLQLSKTWSRTVSVQLILLSKGRHLPFLLFYSHVEVSFPHTLPASCTTEDLCFSSAIDENPPWGGCTQCIFSKSIQVWPSSSLQKEARGSHDSQGVSLGVHSPFLFSAFQGRAVCFNKVWNRSILRKQVEENTCFSEFKYTIPVCSQKCPELAAGQLAHSIFHWSTT